MEALERYIEAISEPEEDLLRELNRETHLRAVQPRMISGHLQGKLLEMITKMLKPRNILEIGTFTGYSTLYFAAGLDEGCTIDTFEVDDELESFASSFFDRSPHREKIHQHTGSALELSHTLGKVFDLVFIDGDKREYPDYYRMLMGDAGNTPLVRSGSFMLADNILWYGKVAQPIAHNDLYTQRIVEFNEIVRRDERIESVVIPIRDGINLIRVK